MSSPSPSQRRARLYTIPISHYGERARWALERAGVSFEEVHVLQMFSWIAAKRRGGKKTLPVLVTSDGVYNDSALIVDYAAEHGAPELRASRVPEHVELEAEIVGPFGVESRRIVYEWVGRSRSVALRTNAGWAPAWQRIAFAALFPVGQRILTRYLDAKPEAMAAARAVVDRTFDRVGEMLGDGRRFLCGDAFSRVDLAFASMAAPCILPTTYGVPLPSPGELPADVAARVLAWRAHTAGAFALRLYAEERRKTPVT